MLYIVCLVCNLQDGGSTIITVSEVRSCVYEVLIVLKELCAHPVFRLEEPREHSIDCYATASGADPVPKAMRALKNEIKSPPILPIDSAQGPKMQRTPAQSIAKEVYSLLKNKLEKTRRLGDAKQAPDTRQLTQRSKDAVANEENDALLAEFWKGEACLYGGASYWKIELCYGKSVSY